MFAQDVIVKKDGSTIVCRVIELNDSEIIYKKWSDLNGSNYVMDKSLASAINYENGKKVSISEMNNNYMPNNQNTGIQQYNDQALIAQDFAVNKYNSIKKRKNWGWIGIGIVGIGGLLCLPTTLENCNQHKEFLITGGLVAATGAITSIYSFTSAHKIQKQAKYLMQSDILLQQDFKFCNGSSLSTNINMINDYSKKEKVFGLGLSYNF